MDRTAKMVEVTSTLNKILGPRVVTFNETTLLIHLEKETDHDRFLELEIKETAVLNVLYNWYNWEILSENIGFCVTVEDEIWGEIDLKGFVE